MLRIPFVSIMLVYSFAGNHLIFCHRCFLERVAVTSQDPKPKRLKRPHMTGMLSVSQIHTRRRLGAMSSHTERQGQTWLRKGSSGNCDWYLICQRMTYSLKFGRCLVQRWDTTPISRLCFSRDVAQGATP